MYSVKKGHRILYGQDHTTIVDWTMMVWERMSIPKHRIIMWLVMLGRIRTRDFLGRIGVVADQNCLLCNRNQEEIPHLFFECTYSLRCLEEIKGWLGWKCQATRLDKLFKWIKKMKQGSLKKHVLYSVLNALVYHVWRVRNSVLWEAKLWLISNTVQRIKDELKVRFKVAKPKKISRLEQEWLDVICAK